MQQAIVVGGGVSGLTCALRLLGAGLDVRVWTKARALETTSNVAAALWYPFHAGPPERTTPWALASYPVFRELARNPASGVCMRDGRELFENTPEAAGWREELDGFARTAAADLPVGFEGAYECRVPVIEMPLYLPFLEHRVTDAGGQLEVRCVESLEEPLAEAEVVVNCSGLASRALAHDESMYPIRGQVVRVERGSVERFLIDEGHPAGVTYVVPRSEDCVLGGSVAEGSDDLEPSQHTTAAILERCRELEPALADARVLSVAVGLRPGRSEVRLEAEELGGRLVVHNYGHGGAGVTLSWGCADEVVECVRTRA